MMGFSSGFPTKHGSDFHNPVVMIVSWLGYLVHPCSSNLIIYFKLKVFDQGISETWGMEIQQPNVLPVEKGNLPKTQGPGFSYHVCVCVGSKNPGFSHGRTELQN